jgi:hypothetical protein
LAAIGAGGGNDSEGDNDDAPGDAVCALFVDFAGRGVAFLTGFPILDAGLIFVARVSWTAGVVFTAAFEMDVRVFLLATAGVTTMSSRFGGMLRGDEWL